MEMQGSGEDCGLLLRHEPMQVHEESPRGSPQQSRGIQHRCGRSGKRQVQVQEEGIRDQQREEQQSQEEEAGLQQYVCAKAVLVQL